MEARNELKFILSNTNDLLKFGETKHAGLILLNSGLIIGIITSYASIHNAVYKPMILVGAIAFGISVFLSIVSQFPVTSNNFFSKENVSNPNIYFFGHLASLDQEEFVMIYKQIDTSFNPTKFHSDLINQILVNARITRSKFMYFKAASYLTAFGAGVIGLSTIIKVVWGL